MYTHHSVLRHNYELAMSYLDKEAYEIAVESYDDPQRHGD